MWDENEINRILDEWITILGTRVSNVTQYPERELWLIEAEDKQEFYLKQLGPYIRSFLHGYHSANQLSARELEALPSLIAAANVIEVSYFMEIAAGKLIRRQLSDHDEVLADSTEAATWHLSHWEDVVDAVVV